MNTNREIPDEVLDALAGEIRAGEPDAQIIEAARNRGWAKLQAAAAAAAASTAHASEAITSCAGFQALLGEYRANTLTPARRMLVEDHLHECVVCRRVLHAESAPKVVEMPARASAPKRASWTVPKWAVAAMLTIGVGLGSWMAWDVYGPAPSGSRMRVLSADGGVYRLQGNTLAPLTGGAELAEGVVLRTSGGGHASVQLLDGSTVEVGERAEFSVAATRKDTTVSLNRGQVIVQAAKRSSGHLFVAAGDSRVAVTGTIFSVNRGIAGARVSVVEGEVHVEHGQAKDVLHSGDQVVTHPSIAKTSVPDDIAWSKNVDQYLALMRSFAAIKGKLSEVHMPGLRYGSKLLGSVPDGTLIYVSLPNLSNAIRDLQRIVNEQAKQSPALATWMQRQMPYFEQVTTQMSRMGDYIGEEVVLAVRPGNKMSGVFLAEANRPGLKEYVEAEMAKNGVQGAPFKIAYTGNTVVIGEPEQVQQAIAAGSNFAATPFGETISSVYRRGAGVFLAVDLEHMMALNSRGPKNGLGDMRHIIVEQKEVNGKTEYSAVVSFLGERRGVASWLAAPGAMGSLDFVSPDAQFAAAFTVKQPAQMLQDLIAMADGKKPDFAEFEQAFGISVEQLASYLGGEITVAFDGPVIPVPSWKLVGEVRDAAGLQAAVGKMISTSNARLAAHGEPTLSLKEENVNGRVFYSMKSPFAKMPLDIYYTYADGYLLAGSSRSLLERALRDRAAGITLSRSGEFRKLLPRESRTSFSGVVYQNAGDLIRTLGDAAGSAVKMTPEQQKQAEELTASMNATVVCLYGEADRIELASQLEPANLLMKGMMAQLLTGKTEQGLALRRKGQ